MAEECIPTALLFQTVSGLLKGDGNADFNYLGLCDTDMSAFDVDTTNFAYTIARESLSPSLETVTKTDDTVVITKSAWKPGADELFGAGIFTGAEDATLQVYHEWAAAIDFESNDTVTQTIKVQSKQGS